MAKQIDERAIHVWLERELTTLAFQLTGWPRALDLWRLLSAVERERLGNDFNGCYNRHHDAAGIWATLRGVSRRRALLDIGHLLGILSDFRYVRWLAEAGESAPAASAPDEMPIWSEDRGTLSFRGKVVRLVRGKTVARNIRAILGAFEDDGWPEMIDDPLTDPGVDGTDKQRLRETVSTLNNGLQDIRFRCDGTGTGVLWELR